MAYKITGALIKKHRLKKNFPKAKLALMIGVEYRGFIEKLEEGSRKASGDQALKLIKFLGISTDQYVDALIADYEIEIFEELGLNKSSDVPTTAEKLEDGESWKNLI